jgi:hypothetical protein
MGIRIRSLLALLTLSLLHVNVSAQSGRTVRWQQGGAGSSRFLRDNVVVKQLVVDGITVTALIIDGISVNIQVSNGGDKPLEVRPEKVELQVTQPALRQLAYIPADRAAHLAVASAHARAASVEMSGGMATKTVVETTTTWSDSPFLGLATDTTQPPRLVTNTTVKTVPDEHARSQARSEAMSIRGSAEGERQRVLNAALKPASISPQGSISGNLYFERDKGVKEVLLRIPLGELTVEIPFKVGKRRLFLWLKILDFQ